MRLYGNYLTSTMPLSEDLLRPALEANAAEYAQELGLDKTPPLTLAFNEPSFCGMDSAGVWYYSDVPVAYVSSWKFEA